MGSYQNLDDPHSPPSSTVVRAQGRGLHLMAWTDGRDSAGQRHLKFQQSFPELSKCKENHISVKNKKYNDQNLFIQIL